MQTLAQAQQQFDLKNYIQSQLHGTANALNAYTECCGRYVGQNKVALIWQGKNNQQQIWTFEQLATASAQLANYFTSLGIQKGQRIAGLLPRTPELLITILATWRIGAVYQPLFTAFESKAIEHRIESADTQLLVTHIEQRAKLNALEMNHILTVAAKSDSKNIDADFWTTVQAQPTEQQPVSLSFADDFLMMFTSGTTGLAKSVAVPLKAVLAFKGYMQYALDLREQDSFWNLADPGWAYGLYYGIAGPLALGHSIILDERNFSVDNALETIEKYKVSNLAGSPTAFRMFFGYKEKFKPELAQHLRVVSSAGEPLTPEVIHWFKQDLGVDIFDQYGQTELGMVIANHHGLAHAKKVGSAGFAIPGHRFAVLNAEHQEVALGEIGTLALDWSQSPLFWFKGYGGNNRQSFVGNYYITGDTVRLNDQGAIEFVGRADDVITTSGYRVGPFDVESTLLECEEVLESAVVGKPDPERTEIVKAFVVLKQDYPASSALQDKLQQYVRQRLSKHVYPREIEFVTQLPKTPSGKIQRNLLKQQEISKLEQLKQVS